MLPEWLSAHRAGARGVAALAVVAVAGLPAAACSAPRAAHPATAPAPSGAPPAGPWGAAATVPGLGGRGLNSGGRASVGSVSCASAGNCMIGGSYRDSSGHQQAYVAAERGGQWGAAVEVPGTAGLNAGGNAAVDSLSCPGAGNCAASGGYTDGHGHGQVFLADEHGGRWGAAVQVPGTAGLGAQQIWDISVSCSGAGTCAARGLYTDGQRHTHLFVLSEHGGRWGTATVVPGTVGGVRAGVTALWCDSTGDCAAGGSYTDGNGHIHAFVAAEHDGRWDPAADLLRTSGLTVGGSAAVSALSCASPGNCGAGGYYADARNHMHLFVTSEQDGQWGTATQIPGLASLNAGGFPQVSSASCASAGNCVVGGWYLDNSSNRHAFVAGEQDGRWGTATGLLGSGVRAWVVSVSCGRPGNCAAGGGYLGKSGDALPFVASERDGGWTATGVPGMHSLVSSTPGRQGEAGISALACLGSGYCLAGGDYVDFYDQTQAFVVSRR